MVEQLKEPCNILEEKLDERELLTKSQNIDSALVVFGHYDKNIVDQMKEGMNGIHEYYYPGDEYDMRQEIEDLVPFYKLVLGLYITKEKETFGACAKGDIGSDKLDAHREERLGRIVFLGEFDLRLARKYKDYVMTFVPYGTEPLYHYLFEADTIVRLDPRFKVNMAPLSGKRLVGFE